MANNIFDFITSIPHEVILSFSPSSVELQPFYSTYSSFIDSDLPALRQNIYRQMLSRAISFIFNNSRQPFCFCSQTTQIKVESPSYLNYFLLRFTIFFKGLIPLFWLALGCLFILS